MYNYDLRTNCGDSHPIETNSSTNSSGANDLTLDDFYMSTVVSLSVAVFIALCVLLCCYLKNQEDRVEREGREELTPERTDAIDISHAPWLSLVRPRGDVKKTSDGYRQTSLIDLRTPPPQKISTPPTLSYVDEDPELSDISSSENLTP